MSWKEALRKPKYRWAIVFIVASAIFFLVFFPPFFDFISTNPGKHIPDPLLEMLPAYDLSIPIFATIYTLIIATLWVNRRSAEIIITALVTYGVVSYLRIFTIYFFTLEPPDGLVTLQDPFVSLVAYDSSFVKDLFFSGHTATLCILTFVEPRRTFRIAKYFATAAVGILLLIQHIHYTIDVIAAPLIVWGVLFLAKRLLNTTSSL